MAKLPITIYKMLQAKQQENFQEYGEDELTMGEVHHIFEMCGYKPSTANKWLLNWAVSHCLKFIPREDGNGYNVNLNDYSDVSLNELMDNNRVWLPVKEVRRDTRGYKANGVRL